MKKILFITWDGPQTSYMEGLFMPIFQEIMRQDPAWEFHVMQFTWAGKEKIRQVKGAAESLGIIYSAVPIIRKPVAAIGSLISLLMGSRKITKYIRDHGIDIVMPRSTFPAFMVNQIKKSPLGGFRGKIIFDADGLPIEERMDFAGLKRESLQYKWLKSIERKMLLRADAVMARSHKAIDVHVEGIGDIYRDKFAVVYNGRDIRQFVLDESIRERIREELDVQDELLWVYAGSLGPQYCWEEMMQVFELSLKCMPSKFLVLTGDVPFATERIPDHLKAAIIVKSVNFEKIPDYLNAADVAFALRRPTYSMQGVAPIKLGEYLLMGLPTIASSGIGDTDDILKNFGECFIFNHDKTEKEQYKEILDWIGQIRLVSRAVVREKAVYFFSLEKAAESYLRVIKL